MTGFVGGTGFTGAPGSSSPGASLTAHASPNVPAQPATMMVSFWTNTALADGTTVAVDFVDGAGFALTNPTTLLIATSPPVSGLVLNFDHISDGHVAVFRLNGTTVPAQTGLTLTFNGVTLPTSPSNYTIGVGVNPAGGTLFSGPAQLAVAHPNTGFIGGTGFTGSPGSSSPGASLTAQASPNGSGQATTLTLSFWTNVDLPLGTFVSIDFIHGAGFVVTDPTAFSIATNPATSGLTMNFDHVSFGQIVTFMLNSDIAAQRMVTISFDGVTVPSSPSNYSIGVGVIPAGGQFFSGPAQLTITDGTTVAGALTAISAAVDPASTSASSTVTVGFTNQQAIPSGGKVEIFLPVGFSLPGGTPTVSGVASSGVQVGSATSGQTVIVITLSSAIDAGTPMQLQIGGLMNPATAGPYAFDIVTESASHAVLDMGTTPSVQISIVNTPVASAVPFVTMVEPPIGSTAGSTNVTIRGVNFVSGASVLFDTTSASNVIVVDSNTITAQTPAHAAGTVSVTVTNPGGLSNSSSAFTYVAAPTITSISPTSGPDIGGAFVLIMGTGLDTVVGVTFGDTPGFVYGGSETSLYVRTPSRTAGAVNVTIKNSAGAEATAAQQFTFTSSATGTAIAAATKTVQAQATVNAGATQTAVANSVFATATAFANQPGKSASTAIVLPVGGSVTGTFSSNIDMVWYSMSVEAGRVYRVSNACQGAEASNYMFLWQLVGGVPFNIGYTDGACGITFTAPATTTLYVSTGGLSSTSYTMTLLQTATVNNTPTVTPTVATATPTVTPTPTATEKPVVAGDSFEIDDVFSAATTIALGDGNAQTHTFHSSLDVDHVKFTASSQGSYVIRTSDLAGGAQTIISIIDNSTGAVVPDPITGSSLTSFADTMTSGATVGQARIALSVSGSNVGRTFVVRISNASPDNYSTGTSYKVRVTRDDFTATPSPVPNAPTNTPTATAVPTRAAGVSDAHETTSTTNDDARATARIYTLLRPINHVGSRELTADGQDGPAHTFHESGDNDWMGLQLPALVSGSELRIRASDFGRSGLLRTEPVLSVWRPDATTASGFRLVRFVTSCAGNQGARAVCTNISFSAGDATLYRGQTWYMQVRNASPDLFGADMSYSVQVQLVAPGEANTPVPTSTNTPLPPTGTPPAITSTPSVTPTATSAPVEQQVNPGRGGRFSSDNGDTDSDVPRYFTTNDSVEFGFQTHGGSNDDTASASSSLVAQRVSAIRQAMAAGGLRSLRIVTTNAFDSTSLDPITNFVLPVGFCVRYSLADLAAEGVSESSLAPYYIDPRTGERKLLGVVRTSFTPATATTSGELCFKTTHFTDFALSGAQVTSTPTPMTGGGGGSSDPLATSTATPSTATATPTATGTVAPNPTSALPTATAGPTFTPVPRAQATATIVAAQAPTVVVGTLSTLPIGIAAVDTSAGGVLGLIPVSATGGAVAVIAPAVGRAEIDPSIIVPAPLAGESALGVRFAPVAVGQVAGQMPSGATAARVFDFSVFDPTTGQLKTTHERPIEFIFAISDADMSAIGNDPSRLAVLRIDSTTGQLERVNCLVDLPYRVARCQTYKTSVFVLSTLSGATAFEYRSFVTGLAKNARAVADTTRLAANAVSSFTIYNTSTARATVAVTFFRADGSAGTSAPLVMTLEARSSQQVYLPSVAGLADGNYAALVSADQVVSVVQNTGTAFGSSGAYGAGTTAATSQNGVGAQFFVPSVYRDYFGYEAAVVVQNADLTQAALVTLNVVSRAGATVLTETRTVPSGAAATVDLSQSSLPVGFTGAAIVTSNKNVAVTYHVFSSDGALATGNAVRTGSAQVYVPSVYNNYYGYDSSLVIQNTDSGTATFTIQYSNGQSSTGSLAAGASAVVYTPNEGLPTGFYGSAVVSSTNGRKLAVVANVRSDALRSLDSFGGFTAGSARTVAPSLFRRYAAQEWGSSFLVQNLGTTATDVLVTYDGGVTQTITGIAAGGSQLVYQPNVAGLADGFYGGATIESVNGSPIVVVVNLEAKATGLPAGDHLLSYQATAS